MKNALLLYAAVTLLITVSCQKDESSSPIPNSEYVVFAWNDLGMHCLNPTYDELVILPPYNNVQVQVIKRGNPPEIITTGITAEFNLVNNTYSFGKRQYGGFWTYFTDIFGSAPPDHDVGLTGTALYGNMIEKSGYFIAEGIPVVPVDDANTWDPLQVIDVKIWDALGNMMANTQAAVPTSDEMNCAKCHSGGALSTFSNILKTHDEAEGTSLLDQKPVLCARCHGSPALGTTEPGTSGKYLSQAIHGSHAGKGAGCYDCHPGASTQCSRSIAHMGTTNDGNCAACHGDLQQVASTIASGRVPWVTEPACVTCHNTTAGVETNDVLYRNSTGHGNLYCSACHGSPHAMYPSREAKDNFQPKQYMGNPIKTIGSCGVCHENSRGEGAGADFTEVHTGSNPEVKNTCYVCHTSISANISNWPHGFTWNNSN